MDEHVLHEIRETVIRMDERLNEVLKHHTHHHSVLFGERGDNGLSGRVSALESAEKRRDWQIKAVFGAAVTAVGGALMNWFSGK